MATCEISEKTRIRAQKEINNFIKHYTEKFVGISLTRQLAKVWIRFCRKSLIPPKPALVVGRETVPKNDSINANNVALNTTAMELAQSIS